MGQIKVNQHAPINEIVGLLNAYSQSELSSIQEEFPEYEKFLKPGIIMGEDEASEDEIKELKIRTKVCKTGLNLIIQKSAEFLPKVKSRLKLLNSVQFISQIVIAITGASIMVFLQEKHGESVKIIIGCLTLIAAILTLYVQHKSGTIGLGENSLSKIFNDLTDSKLTAEHYLQELKIIEELNFSSSVEEVSQIIKKSNDISSDMKKIIEKN
ncbi:hypothetical protein [uncultured Aquimarina sp.]|uniref:hypothetical protein n=1 Tax=uncultured Aquimarina sp. TaxID=575652 RepID=UPI002617E6E5|nr:hypothetical protein [uncultured Aquimarina sp.]